MEVRPQERVQPVIFVRHGVAWHNVLNPQGGGGHRHDLFDPPLTTDGKMQAVLVGDTIRGWLRQQRPREPQYMVLTSPLTRCLQTAMYAFGIPSDSSSHTTTTFQCHENLREACGIHKCDARRTKSELQQCWDGRVQFSPTMSERDELWSSERRETIADVQRRIQDFLSVLIALPEPVASTTTDANGNVVFIVVTHGVWIETLLRVHQAPYHLLYTETPHPPAGANAATPPVAVPKRVYNGDAYYCECISSSSSPNQPRQLQRMQNFHQICGPQTLPTP
jgi:broad specificity phosphatase PhoE